MQRVYCLNLISEKNQAGMRRLNRFYLDLILRDSICLFYYNIWDVSATFSCQVRRALKIFKMNSNDSFIVHSPKLIMKYCLISIDPYVYVSFKRNGKYLCNQKRYNKSLPPINNKILMYMIISLKFFFYIKEGLYYHIRRQLFRIELETCSIESILLYSIRRYIVHIFVFFLYFFCQW